MIHLKWVNGLMQLVHYSLKAYNNANSADAKSRAAD